MFPKVPMKGNTIKDILEIQAGRTVQSIKTGAEILKCSLFITNVVYIVDKVYFDII